MCLRGKDFSGKYAEFLKCRMITFSSKRNVAIKLSISAIII